MVEAKDKQGGRGRRLRAVAAPPRAIEQLVLDGPFTETKEMIAAPPVASRTG